MATYTLVQPIDVDNQTVEFDTSLKLKTSKRAERGELAFPNLDYSQESDGLALYDTNPRVHTLYISPYFREPDNPDSHLTTRYPSLDSALFSDNHGTPRKKYQNSVIILNLEWVNDYLPSEEEKESYRRDGYNILYTYRASYYFPPTFVGVHLFKRESPSLPMGESNPIIFDCNTSNRDLFEGYTTYQGRVAPIIQQYLDSEGRVPKVGLVLNNYNYPSGNTSPEIILYDGNKEPILYKGTYYGRKCQYRLVDIYYNRPTNLINSNGHSIHAEFLHCHLKKMYRGALVVADSFFSITYKNCEVDHNFADDVDTSYIVELKDGAYGILNKKNNGSGFSYLVDAKEDQVTNNLDESKFLISKSYE